MREAVIVSTARTPIGRAGRGAFNDTDGQVLAGHAIQHAVSRAGLEGAEVEDVVLGNAIQKGTTGGNVARQALLRAGLPTSVAGMTIDRMCSSGLMGIATAAKEIIVDGFDIIKDFRVQADAHKETAKHKEKVRVEAAEGFFATYANLLSVEAQIAWEKVVERQIGTAPWMDLKRQKHTKEQGMTKKSFHDYVTHHLLTVFTIDAVE